MAVAGLLLLPCGCAGKGPGKGTLHLVLAATPECNSCGKPSGYPLTYRLVQVTDPGVMAGLSLTQVWGKEAKLMGPACLATREDFVDPGQTKELAVERAPGAVAMIVIGNFCRTKGTDWYRVQPLAKSGRLKLVAGSDGFTVAK